MSATDTTSRFARSTGAAAFSQIWRSGVTFITTLALMRLVSPGSWGLYEWVLPVFMVLGAIRDMGLVYHVVRVRPRPYGNLLAVEALWGGALAAAAFFGAETLARGFRAAHPDTVGVIRAFSLYLLFEGLASVPRVYFDAELRVGRTVVPEIVRNLVFTAISISMALADFGVWSLAVAQIASTGVYAVHLWWRARGSIPIRWAEGATWQLLRQSLPLATIWFLAILAQRVDPLILALRFDAATIGNYTRAYFVAILTSTIFAPAVARTLYPALVEFVDRPGRLFEAYRLSTLFILCCEVPAAAFLLLNPEATIRILGGKGWTSAPDFLTLLCLAPLVDPFSRLGGEVLKVYHRDRLWILCVFLTLTSFAVGGYLLTGRFGPLGMAMANFLPLGAAVMAWGLHSIAPRSFRRLARDLALVYAAPVVPFLAVYLITPTASAWRFGFSVAAALAVFAFYYLRFGSAFRLFFRRPEEDPEPPA